MLDTKGKDIFQEQSWWRQGFPACSLNSAVFPQTPLSQSETSFPETPKAWQINVMTCHTRLSQPPPPPRTTEQKPWEKT